MGSQVSMEGEVCTRWSRGLWRGNRRQPVAGTEHLLHAGGHEGLLPPQRGSPPGPVESGFAKKTFISCSKSFQNSSRQGVVVEMDLKESDGAAGGWRGPALLASYPGPTGSTGFFPGKLNRVFSQQEAMPAYENMVKQVTLTHSQMALADKELLPCVRQEAKEILLQKGVQLLLSERVSNMAELPFNEYRECTVYRRTKALRWPPTWFIVCNGIKINSFAYHRAFDSVWASNGALRVNGYLQVEGYSHIYAISDCARREGAQDGLSCWPPRQHCCGQYHQLHETEALQGRKMSALTFPLAWGEMTCGPDQRLLCGAVHGSAGQEPGPVRSPRAGKPCGSLHPDEEAERETRYHRHLGTDCLTSGTRLTAVQGHSFWIRSSRLWRAEWLRAGAEVVVVVWNSHNGISLTQVLKCLISWLVLDGSPAGPHVFVPRSCPPAGLQKPSESSGLMVE
ncbi:LOW QUALITY PROTEIN: hypothetical protein QTO34_018348 [Cnephaeus nilssonii]|uniref:Ferroptosis suppressor protein 1 n=1 Tax=Cnephaeus nilssonii TaxID=3371016 RepID=A0AA40HYP2_CNENI|nr:LOW QUALITY PROTEIN: hypothetical protein QTO34_018348 [Eptesicus nilssonii]